LGSLACLASASQRDGLGAFHIPPVDGTQHGAMRVIRCEVGRGKHETIFSIGATSPMEKL
jgi:hypothetical protein